MKSIVIDIKPFALKQKVMVFEDHNILNTDVIPMKDLVAFVVKSANNLDITDVKIAGPAVFNKGIAKQIVKEEVIRYNSKNIVVELI